MCNEKQTSEEELEKAAIIDFNKLEDENEDDD